ncbi:hypothetical protein C2845_PM05G04610 [Panicum miliaceum]|uniref:Ubiquitin-like protease family profile domain-containing protein n=1 Tax=Panicum miliaceum TaxID=4540 RepID=A0A3L6T0Q6_PANMI|nr:hypothetical protein C2845_PM05G04610 [Panicum miliaceum]
MASGLRFRRCRGMDLGLPTTRWRHGLVFPLNSGRDWRFTALDRLRGIGDTARWGDAGRGVAREYSYLQGKGSAGHISGNLALLQCSQLALRLGYWTTQSKNKTIEPPSIPVREGSGGRMPERQQGVTKRQRQILESLANDARTDIGLQMDKRLLQIEHKFDKKMIAQNEELAKLKKDKIMEVRLSGIEDDIAEMQTDIKGSPSTQQLVDPSPHIARREPIIDHNYKLTEDDNDAAAFVELSYDNETMVEIEGHLIEAKQLRAIVSEGFMVGEIIDAYVDISNVKNASVSFICTLQAMVLLTNNLRNEKYMQFRKLINDKCVGRHLIFVPKNVNNNYWVLLVLNLKKIEVQILNSIAEMRDKEKEKALEEAYFAKYPEEQRKDTQDEDDNNVEMVVNGTGNTSTPADSKIGGKGGKGTPSTTAASTEGGTGPAKRKRGRPRKIPPPTPGTASSAVLEKFSLKLSLIELNEYVEPETKGTSNLGHK